jgi:hypothetical protein
MAMTETSHTDRFTWKTPLWFVIALAAVLAVAIAVTTLTTNRPSHDQFDTTPSYLEERDQYEQALLDHPNRQGDTFNTYIEDDGALYYSGGDVTNGGYCEYRCLVAEEAEGGVAVTVPVSFKFTGYAGDTPALTNIVELTYWDPVDHAPKTIRAAEGETVQLPDVLRDDNIVSDMKVGEIAYVWGSAVRLSNHEVIVLEENPLWYEPNCSYNEDIGDLCGWGPIAQIQRTEEGFAACVPEWQEGDGVSANSLPNFDTSVTDIDDSAATKLNYVADATGYEIHTLQVC